MSIKLVRTNMSKDREYLFNICLRERILITWELSLCVLTK